MGPKRAHLDWVKNGDTNSKFFHSTYRLRSQFNSISQVTDLHGNIHADQMSIANVFLNFYKQLWTSRLNPSLDVLNSLPTNLPYVSEDLATILIREVTKKEVYGTILDLPSGMSPGPNDFNVEFIIFSSLLLRIIFSFLFDFSLITILCRRPGVKLTLFLFPKRIGLSPLLISSQSHLCNICFEIITKISANRIKLILPSLIGHEQAGFVSGHSPFDNIIVVQEIVHSLDNDTKTPPPPFNHLIYADDLILVTSASRRASRTINLCLARYSYLTGQRPDLNKFQIFPPHWCNKFIQNKICSILNLCSAVYPFKYLGILISPRKTAATAFRLLVDKIRHTCNRWSNLHLSAAAKTILINSNLLSTPIYILLVYSIP